MTWCKNKWQSAQQSAEEVSGERLTLLLLHQRRIWLAIIITSTFWLAQGAE
jgi:hypothetical protein